MCLTLSSRSGKTKYSLLTSLLTNFGMRKKSDVGGYSQFDLLKFLVVEQSVKIHVMCLTLSSRSGKAKYSLLTNFEMRKKSDVGG